MSSTNSIKTSDESSTIQTTYRASGIPWLGDIPLQWQVKKIKHSTYVKARIGWQGLQSGEFVDHGPYCVTGTDFVNGSINWSTCYHVGHDRYDQDPYIQLREADLLITKDGTIGKVALVRGLDGPATLNSGVFVTRPRADEYDNAYLYWILNSRVFQSFFEYIGMGSTIVHLYQRDFVKFAFGVPSIPEQRAIASFLDRKTSRIDSLIAKKERLIELLQQKRMALVSEIVTKGLDGSRSVHPSGVEWLGSIPSNWEVKKLKYVLKGGLANGLFKTKEHFGTGVKLINVIDIYTDDWQIEFANLERVAAEPREIATYRVLPGDIFFVRSSLKMEGVAASACILTVPEEAVFECHLVRVTPAPFMDPKYLVTYLNSSVVRQRLVSLAETTTMTTIAQPKLGSLEILVPPIAEQQRIMAFLDKENLRTARLVAQVREAIEKLHEYRSALITAAVTGKIDVREEVAV